MRRLPICKYCEDFILPESLAYHCRTKHRINLETKSPKPRRVKNKHIQKDANDRFPEPLYERQPRFEGGIRWEQGGSPGLGKRR